MDAFGFLSFVSSRNVTKVKTPAVIFCFECVGGSDHPKQKIHNNKVKYFIVPHLGQDIYIKK